MEVLLKFFCSRTIVNISWVHHEVFSTKTFPHHFTYVDTSVVNVHLLFEAHVEACIRACRHWQLLVHLMFEVSEFSLDLKTSAASCCGTSKINLFLKFAKTSLWSCLSFSLSSSIALTRAWEGTLTLVVKLNTDYKTPVPIVQWLWRGSWLYNTSFFEWKYLDSFQLWIVANVCGLIVTL